MMYFYTCCQKYGCPLRVCFNIFWFLLLLLYICDLTFYLFFKDRQGNWIRDGWWVLVGLLVFVIVEKLFSLSDNKETDDNTNVSTDINAVNNNLKDVGKWTSCNGNVLTKATAHIQVYYT